MGEVDRFIWNHEDELLPEEVDFLHYQCSDADEYHDIVRHLTRFRRERAVEFDKARTVIANVRALLPEEGCQFYTQGDSCLSIVGDIGVRNFGPQHWCWACRLTHALDG